jgi:transcriptional regulator with XRE-family HTH domain
MATQRRQPISEAHVAYGARLRTARENARLSREELGRRVNFSAKTVERYENGQSLPPADAVRAWEKACRVAQGVLLDDEYRALSPRPRAHVTFSVDGQDGIDESGDREILLDPGREPTLEAYADEGDGGASDSLPGSGALGAARARRWLVALGIFGVILVTGVVTVELVVREDDRTTHRSPSQTEQFVEGMRAFAARLDRGRVEARRQLASTASGQRVVAAEQLSDAYAQAATASRHLDPPTGVGSLHAQLDGALLRARDAYAALAIALRQKDRVQFDRARDGVQQAEDDAEMVLTTLDRRISK